MRAMRSPRGRGQGEGPGVEGQGRRHWGWQGWGGMGERVGVGGKGTHQVQATAVQVAGAAAHGSLTRQHGAHHKQRHGRLAGPRGPIGHGRACSTRRCTRCRLLLLPGCIFLRERFLQKGLQGHRDPQLPAHVQHLWQGMERKVPGLRAVAATRSRVEGILHAQRCRAGGVDLAPRVSRQRCVRPAAPGNRELEGVQVGTACAAAAWPSPCGTTGSGWCGPCCAGSRAGRRCARRGWSPAPTAAACTACTPSRR